MKLYQRISALLTARKNCETSGNTEWHRRHTDALLAIVQRYMPSGSGFDSGTQIDLDRSKPNRLVFDTSFHHMDGNGYYDGWTDHRIAATPDFISRFSLTISGRDRNKIKDFVYDTFATTLNQEVKE